MFSYLNTIQPTSNSMSVSQSEEIKAQKFKLTAIAGSSSSSSSRGNKRRSKRALIAKSYNPVAGRPIRDMLNRVQTYTAHLRYDVTNIIATSTTVPTFGASTFVISSFDNYLQYLNLFDQYRIDSIEVWIEPACGPAQSNTSVGQLYSAIDLDDANTPTTIVSVEDHQSCLTTSTMAGHYHRWAPHVAVAVYSGTFTSFSNSPPTWIDAASPNVQHYGLKLATTPSTTASITVSMQVRAKVSFRQSGL